MPALMEVMVHLPLDGNDRENLLTAELQLVIRYGLFSFVTGNMTDLIWDKKHPTFLGLGAWLKW
jgi:hypothetical protein